MSHIHADPITQQIAAIRARAPRLYILLPVHAHQTERHVYAFPAKHVIKGVHYRDIFIPNSPHEGNRRVRADRLRRVTK